jgi:hypothetical protein
MDHVIVEKIYFDVKMNKKLAYLLLMAIPLSACSHSPTNTEPPVSSVSEDSSATTVHHSENQAHPVFNRENVYTKLYEISKKSQYSKLPSFKSESISLILPSDKNSEDQKSEWHYTYVEAFSKNVQKVDQIAIFTMTCNAVKDPSHTEEIQKRLMTVVKHVSEKVLGSSFELQGAPYFKKLGPFWNKKSHVAIQQPYAPVTRMRLGQGIYKCDERGGYGYRYDFFLK